MESKSDFFKPKVEERSPRVKAVLDAADFFKPNKNKLEAQLPRARVEATLETTRISTRLLRDLIQQSRRTVDKDPLLNDKAKPPKLRRV